MSPLNKDQLEQKRNERKEQILAAALKVFAENGIKSTKISMIAAEAGTSHGLLYHYFKSKEEVLHASLEEAMSKSKELFQALEELQLSPLAKIKHFTKVALSEGNSDIFRVIQHIFHSVDHVPEHTLQLVQENGSLYIKHFYPVFLEGQEKGEIIKADTTELLELFLSILTGLLSEGDLEWWQNNLDRKIDLLLRVLTAR